jgi:tetratricopeptide (TPR) repeat protein
VLEQALAGARRSRDRSTELRVTIERASVALLSDPSQADAILQQVEAALPALEELGDDRALAMGWTLIGQLRGSWRGRFADGEEALERALQHARRGGDRRQEAPILRELALAAVWGPRSVDEAAGRCREILELAGGDPLIEAGILRSLAELEARRGSFEEARRLARRASSIYDDVGVLGVMPVSVAFALGEIELLAEDYKAAERELRAGWDALDRIGEQGYRSSAAAFLAQALYGQQRMLEAEEFALRAQEAAAPDDIWSQVVSRGTRAKVLSSRGDHGSAEKLAREAVGRLADTDGLDIRAGALADLGEVLLRAGRRAEAGHTAAEALRLCEQKGNLVTAARMRRLAARAAENAVMVAKDQDDRAS